jgi:hypothetical protein
MLQEYKCYWISGKAGLVHAFSPESYVARDLQTGGRESDRRGYPLRIAVVRDDGIGFSGVLRARTGEDSRSMNARRRSRGHRGSVLSCFPFLA